MLAIDAEVVPLGDGRYEVRRRGEVVVIDATLVPVLATFERGATIATTADAAPGPRAAAERALQALEAANILVPFESEDALVWPDRAPVADTLFGAPRFAPDTPVAFGFLGVPYDGGTTHAPGARYGPESIRAGSHGMVYSLHPHSGQPLGFFDTSSGRTVLEGVWMSDAGDVVVPPGSSSHELFDRVEGAVSELLASGAIPVLLGGDHSITYPALRAFPREPVGIIHIDAHTDLGSVEIDRVHHGNVFRAVLDRLPHVDRVVQVGLRGFLSGAEDQTHPRAFPVGMATLEEAGVSAVLDAAPDDLSYYLSIDIDAVDPAYAPSTGTPVPGGLTSSQLLSLVDRIAWSRRIVGIDLTEVAQRSGPQDPTGQLAATTLLVAMAAVARRMKTALAEP
ncbi:MAG: arginase family protein [Deltaproteobacteria bacterium]